MISIKLQLYYLFTKYFQIWAKLVLRRWKPIIIAVVGSAGKTSTMLMIEQVLKNNVSIKTSYKTNAASSIPLNILGLTQHSFSAFEWLILLIKAPFAGLKTYKEKIYLCELDTDRDGEMKLHTNLIKPDICCWISASPAHTANFSGLTDQQVYQNMLDDQSEAVKKTKSLILVNEDDTAIKDVIKQIKTPIQKITFNSDNNDLIWLLEHKLSFNGTNIDFGLNPAKLASLIGRNINYNHIEIHNPHTLISFINLYGVAMAIIIGISFGLDPKQIAQALQKFRLPPGRMSLFAGKHATTIIDSTYNASKLATKDALDVLKLIGTNKTLAVLGDLRELGTIAKQEHEDLAKYIVSQKIDRVILVGPTMKDFALPIFINNGYQLGQTVFALSPKETKGLINQAGFLKNGETVLIKGSQNTLFLEEIVASLLVSQKDYQNLCRREAIWNVARAKIY